MDITLKVKERGKNSIQLNGGVSAIAGSFVGFSYSTNNFLGLGETLSLSTQLGTVQRSAQFGFTEPYLFDLPLQVGFTVFTSRFNYDQAREASILSGTEPDSAVQPAWHAKPAELRFQFERLHDFRQLSAEAQLRPRWGSATAIRFRTSRR